LRVELAGADLSLIVSPRSSGPKDNDMSAPRTESLRSHLETLIALARLLERVEASPIAIGADQYRALIGQVKAALGPALPEQALQAILAAHPATAEVYENLHYETSGLSRSSLERSVSTEMLASQLLHKIARSAP
jgi:hypothetical protein